MRKKSNLTTIAVDSYSERNRIFKELLAKLDNDGYFIVNYDIPHKLYVSLRYHTKLHGHIGLHRHVSVSANTLAVWRKDVPPPADAMY